MWTGLFSTVNVIAMIGWVLLAFLPRKALVHSAVLFLGVALLCLIYAVLLGLVLSGSVDPALAAGAAAVKPGYSSIPAVRAIFSSDGGVVVGWTHYLAFDLFIGLWIARDADSKGFSRLVQLPFLTLTFLFGPTGLLAWLVVREARARKLGRG